MVGSDLCKKISKKKKKISQLQPCHRKSLFTDIPPNSEALKTFGGFQSKGCNPWAWGCASLFAQARTGSLNCWGVTFRKTDGDVQAAGVIGK